MYDKFNFIIFKTCFMKHKLLILACFSAVVFTSCKSSYKNMQTPDDLYYSPATGMDKEEVKEDKNTIRLNNNNDRFLTYKVRNRNLWGCIDDYSYWNDIRYNNCNCYNGNYNHWNSPYINNMWSWQGYHYPNYYLAPYAYTTIKTGNSINTKITSYNNTNYNNTNIKPVKSSSSISFPSINPTRTFETSGSAPSSNAGGNSGGFNSTGSSAEKPRQGRP